jgi:hypothetical protein
MAQLYKFAVVRLAPDDSRGESVNIGAIVFSPEGMDVRVSRRLEKVRALSAALDTDTLRELLDNLKGLDQHILNSGITDAEKRIETISRLGPLSLSQAGAFVADTPDAYESRVASLVKAMVDPEPALPRAKRKSSKLLTQLKSAFREERVLAKKDEDLDSHRIVPAYELDEGLVADLVLRNGAMHVVETVDASSDEVSFKKAVSDIAVAALVLERARMKFGEKRTRARLVYNASAALEKAAQPSLDAAAHQGAELINWASTDERLRFVHSLSSLATPLQRNRRKHPQSSGGGFLPLN